MMKSNEERGGQMTEVEQLRADMATIQEAAEIAKIRGFHELVGNYDQVEDELKQKIAKLEAQEQVDPWERARGCVDYALKHYLHNSNGREIALYARHLEAKVADLEEEVRRALIVQSASVGKAKKFREKLAELTTIANAIPPACGLAQELVKRRIEGVKKEMQESEAGQ